MSNKLKIFAMGNLLIPWFLEFIIYFKYWNYLFEIDAKSAQKYHLCP